MKALARIRLEDIAVVLILMFFGVAGAIPGIAPNQANEMTGAAAGALQTVVGVGSQLMVNGLIACQLMRSWRLLRQARAHIGWPLLLASWAVVSILWSQDKVLSTRRALPFGLAAAFGVYLALRFPPRRFLTLLQITFAALALWSAVLALGFPSIGLDASNGHTHDWQGVFTQKNACGRAMVFAIGSVLAGGRLSPGRLTLLLLFTAELAMSGSRGAWLLGVVVIVSLSAFRLSCRFDRASRTALFAAVALGGTVVAIIGISQFGSLAPLLGRDATLTGRTAIWHEVWLSILHRPLLGYGFSAFWRGAQGASWDVVVALKFVLFHAHNGFLEIWLGLGAVGLALFTLGFLRAAFLLWPELSAGRYEEAAWPFCTLLLIALYDLDENTLLSFNGLFWVLYCGVLARVELLAAERRAVSRLLQTRQSQLRLHLFLPGMGKALPAQFMHRERLPKISDRPWSRTSPAATGEIAGSAWR